MSFVKLLFFIGFASDIRTQASMEGYVVGGNYALINDYPHAAFLSISCLSDQLNSWICGASILNNFFTLTAGHCLEECDRRSKILISVGSENRLKGTTLLASAFKIHERYDTYTMSNDIAVVRVKTPIRFSQNVKRVVLSRNNYFNEEAYVSGWGVVDEYEKVSTAKLKHVRQTLWSRHECIKILRHVPVGCICAGPKNSRTNYAAEGDSGSALVVRGYLQVGIVSFKIPKESKSLAIYTEVKYFYDWIKSTTKKMFCMTGK